MLSHRPSAPGPGFVLARLLLASVFIVMGTWRLWNTAHATAPDTASLAFSAAELLLGLLVALGWKLRWTALLSALLMAMDAAMSHPFWALAEPERSAQLLHFMKNVNIVGGFLLLALVSSNARRR